MSFRLVKGLVSRLTEPLHEHGSAQNSEQTKNQRLRSLTIPLGSKNTPMVRFFSNRDIGLFAAYERAQYLQVSPEQNKGSWQLLSLVFHS